MTVPKFAEWVDAQGQPAHPMFQLVQGLVAHVELLSDALSKQKDLSLQHQKNVIDAKALIYHLDTVGNISRRCVCKLTNPVKQEDGSIVGDAEVNEEGQFIKLKLALDPYMEFLVGDKQETFIDMRVWSTGTIQAIRLWDGPTW